MSTTLILGIALVSSGALFLFAVPRVPAAQRGMLRTIAIIDILGGLAAVAFATLT
jgi:hypothetical protein